MASQITSLTSVYSIVYSGADQRKHQSSASLALCGEYTGTGEFPAQMASYAETVSIWWRHHAWWLFSVFPLHILHICLLYKSTSNICKFDRWHSDWMKYPAVGVLNNSCTGLIGFVVIVKRVWCNIYKYVTWTAIYYWSTIITRLFAISNSWCFLSGMTSQITGYMLLVSMMTCRLNGAKPFYDLCRHILWIGPSKRNFNWIWWKNASEFELP